MSEYEKIPGAMGCGNYDCSVCYRKRPTRKTRAKVVKQVSFDMLMGRSVKVTEETTAYSPDDTVTHYEYVRADEVIEFERENYRDDD